MAQGRSARRSADAKQKKKEHERTIKYHLGVEYHLQCCLEVLRHQEKQLLRENRRRAKLRKSRREELFATRRRSFQPDNPVTPDLRPLVALDPLAQVAPMSPLQLESDAESEEKTEDKDLQVCSDEQMQDSTSAAEPKIVEVNLELEG